MLRSILLVLVFLLLTVGCATSPTRRRQLILFSEVELEQMGAASFEQQKQEVPLTQNAGTSRRRRPIRSASI